MPAPAATAFQLAALLALAAGCGGAPPPRLDVPLPLTVLVEPLEASSRTDGVTPVVLDDPAGRARRLADDLAAAGLFAEVLIDDDLEDDPDLRPDAALVVALTGHDFGSSRILVAGGIFSIIAWMFAGPASWWIDERVYESSPVAVEVRLEVRSAGPALGPPATGAVALETRGLSLHFAERSRWPNWLLGILLPPLVDPGDSMTAGRSLTDKAVDRILENLPAVRAELAGRLHGALGHFLGHDAEAGAVVIASRLQLERVSIRRLDATPGEEAAREHRIDNPLDHEVREAFGPLRDMLAATYGLDLDGRQRFYRIDLPEMGLLGVTLTFEDGASSSWTVLR